MPSPPPPLRGKESCSKRLLIQQQPVCPSTRAELQFHGPWLVQRQSKRKGVAKASDQPAQLARTTVSGRARYWYGTGHGPFQTTSGTAVPSIQTNSKKQRQRHGRPRLSTSHVNQLLLGPMKCAPASVAAKRFLRDDRSARSARRSRATQGNLRTLATLRAPGRDEARKEEKKKFEIDVASSRDEECLTHASPSGLLMSRPAYNPPPPQPPGGDLIWNNPRGEVTLAPLNRLTTWSSRVEGKMWPTKKSLQVSALDSLLFCTPGLVEGGETPSQATFRDQTCT